MKKQCKIAKGIEMTVCNFYFIMFYYTGYLFHFKLTLLCSINTNSLNSLESSQQGQLYGLECTLKRMSLLEILLLGVLSYFSNNNLIIFIIIGLHNLILFIIIGLENLKKICECPCRYFIRQ